MNDMNEPLSLTNICEGKLEEEFQKVYPALLSQLKHGDKASLAIKLDFSRVADTETMIKMEYSVKPTFPARKKSSIGQITDDFKVKTEKVPEKVKQLSIAQGGTING